MLLSLGALANALASLANVSQSIRLQEKEVDKVETSQQRPAAVAIHHYSLCCFVVNEIVVSPKYYVTVIRAKQVAEIFLFFIISTANFAQEGIKQTNKKGREREGSFRD